MGRNAFDEAVRNTLRPNEQGHRNVARDASDIMLMLSINQVLVDTLIVTWWGHDADTVAYNMALMNIEAIAFNTALNQLVGGLASRERPYRVECDQLPDEELRSDCRGRKRFRSFYSGHASTTFAVAGLTCMHHAQLPLYGGGFADVLPCVASFAIAGTTGTLRLVADQHWATDVLVGAAMGTFSGLAVPYFLHYGWGEPEEHQPDEISIRILPLPTGGMVSGMF
ncbi:MAG TPA: phosphatase PAP2 family protein [Polyangiaceae bacterium]|nr:phosphatase PAP2 family protein [Polyangiaceae bacterium]